MAEFNKISQSALNDYLRCPKLFYYRQLLKMKLAKKGLPLVFGSSIHKGLEEYEDNGEDPIQVFLDDFKYEDVLWVNYQWIPYTEEEAEEIFEAHVENGIRLLEYFLEEREGKKGKLYNYEVLHTEERFKVKINDQKKKKCLIEDLSGIVDVVRTDEKLADYKTSSKKYSQKMVDESVQPTMYYLWYYLTYGKLPKGFIYIVFMKKRKKDPIDVLETHRTMADIVKLISTINMVKKKVDKGWFNRSHGRKGFCDCYKYEEMFNSKLEISYDRPKKMVYDLGIA